MLLTLDLREKPERGVSKISHPWTPLPCHGWMCPVGPRCSRSVFASMPVSSLLLPASILFTVSGVQSHIA